MVLRNPCDIGTNIFNRMGPQTSWWELMVSEGYGKPAQGWSINASGGSQENGAKVIPLDSVNHSGRNVHYDYNGMVWPNGDQWEVKSEIQPKVTKD